MWLPITTCNFTWLHNIHLASSSLWVIRPIIYLSSHLLFRPSSSSSAPLNHSNLQSMEFIMLSKLPCLLRYHGPPLHGLSIMHHKECYECKHVSSSSSPQDFETKGRDLEIVRAQKESVQRPSQDTSKIM